MKKIVIIILIVVIGVVGYVGTKVNAADTFHTEPARLYADFPNGSGATWARLIITNSSGSSQSFEVSHWWNYTTKPDYLQVGEDWIKNFSPSPITLPPKGVGIVNFLIEVPEGTEDAEYLTYLKVRNDPVTEERPISIYIRTGDAVPVFKYAMSPGALQVVVKGQGDALQEAELRITNQGTGDSSFVLSPSRQIQREPETRTVTLTDGTAKTQWNYMNSLNKWTDWKYEPLVLMEYADNDEELANIIRCDSKPTFIPGVTDFQPISRTIPFTVFVPGEIPSGHYVVYVRVDAVNMPTNVTGIGIAYECIVYIDIDRTVPGVADSGLPIWMFGAIGGGALLGIMVVPRVVRKMRRRNRRRVLTT